MENLKYICVLKWNVYVKIIPWLTSTATKKATLTTKIIFDILLCALISFVTLKLKSRWEFDIQNATPKLFIAKNFQLEFMRWNVVFVIFQKGDSKIMLPCWKLVIDKLDGFNNTTWHQQFIFFTFVCSLFQYKKKYVILFCLPLSPFFSLFFLSAQ